MKETLLNAMTEIDVAILPVKSGSIYALVDEDEIVYIGKTTNIGQRLWMHKVGTRRTPAKVFSRALRLDVPIDDLDAFEGALIRRFNPRYCNSAPANKGRDTEVLASLGLEPDSVNEEAFGTRRSNIFVVAARERRVREWARRGWRRQPTFSKVLWKSTLEFLEASS